MATASPTIDTLQVQTFVFGRDTVKVGVTLGHVADTVLDSIFVHDTLVGPPPASTGVDTIVKGDTTKYAFWHMGKIVDSVRVAVKPTPPPVTTKGQPLGATRLMNEATQPYTPFNEDAGASSGKPNYAISNLNDARARKIKVVLNLPCGSHNPSNAGPCLKQVNGVWVFNRKAYDSALATYNTPEVHNAMLTAYNDSILLGINIMDEPWVKGQGDGNTWGPNGLTRYQADSNCVSAKKQLPKVPIGLSDTGPDTWPVGGNNGTLAHCDIGVSQYSYRFGDQKAWIKTMNSQASSAGYVQMYQFNVVNGGTQDKDTIWDCAQQGGIKGSRSPNCTMTPSQITTVIKTYAGQGCGGVTTWQYDTGRMPKVISGFNNATDSLSKTSWKICKPR